MVSLVRKIIKNGTNSLISQKPNCKLGEKEKSVIFSGLVLTKIISEYIIKKKTTEAVRYDQTKTD